MSTCYDAVIVGAGPAGATLACLLARSGRAVAVVERAPFPRRKMCGEFVSAANLPLLARLGVADAFGAAAGPAIRRVGLFAGDAALAAPMPRPRGAGWGRALGREHLDTLLLARARALGAAVLQPWAATALERDGAAWRCTVRSAETGAVRTLRARFAVAAHGSWEAGPLPSHVPAPPHRASDLLGFKAHLRGCSLPSDLMPLLAFPGGYGGLVATDGGRASLSCCVRRDALAALRRRHRGLRAGEAVLAHIRANLGAAREALAGAELEGAILSAGPIRPGLRPRVADGIVRIGNAAGEAHPVIAEGIGMAMQSARLLFDTLEAGAGRRDAEALAAAAELYARRWVRAFAPRLAVGAAIARLAIHPASAAAMRALVALWPRALTAGAYLSGKAA
jgi:flavin-dependent dehydrogenase